MKRYLCILFLLILTEMPGAPVSRPLDSVRAYRRAHEQAIWHEFAELLAIPNVASDAKNIRKNAERLMAMLRRRGIEPRLLESQSTATPPVVYGERRVPGARRTLVFYAHYDGQPVDPSQWAVNPWAAVLCAGPLAPGGPCPEARLKPGMPLDPEWRVYARSAADDKAAILAMLTAYDALAAAGQPPTSHLKFFFEGEEEAGSPHLGEIIGRYKDLLRADAWIMCDGPVHQSGRKQVAFGARGDTHVDVTVYGAIRPLHSGHYGNWAPNPAMHLAKLLASMKDDRGRVTIAGFYDDVEPLGDAERRALAAAPDYDAELMRQLGFAGAEGGGQSLLELINQPSLNINGMRSADVGALARNVIPTQATATLDLRLVKGNDYRRQVDRVIRHIRQQGFYVTESEPTPEERRQHPRIARVTRRSGYNAERTPMDLPISVSVLDAVQSAADQPIVKLPTLGGSLPLYILKEALGAPTIIVPIANYDNNQHAENENLRIQNLWDGIEIMAALMTMK